MKKPPSGKTLRHQVRQVLETESFEQIEEMPPRKLVRPLVSFLGTPDPALKERAVRALGAAVSRLAEEDMESARVVLRTLVWNLTEECGTIGFGFPEAMGEILAHHEGLAREFAHMLVSYIREDGNYLEFEPLQEGVVWGLARLAESQPALLRELDAESYLRPLSESANRLVSERATRAMRLIEVE